MALFRPFLRLPWHVTLLLGVCLLLPAPAHGQADDVPDVTRTYALVGARIVTAPGQVIDRGTVVVRDGLIHAVGADVEVPFDAQRIEADSLIVYAGFIDGLSHTGIPKPEGTSNRERVDEPGNPPNDRAGIQPDRLASTFLDPAEDAIENLRKVGFTVAHVVPHGELLPGQGAVILLGGDDPEAMLVAEPASLFAQFESARGVYPSTDMAILAKIRQLYREAERRQEASTLYAENAAGLPRPEYDAVHAAFFPVIDQRLPVAFRADRALEVHRVLTLQEQLGFPLMLTGLAQAFEVTDALAEADVPLFITLDLPEEPKDAAPDSTVAPDSLEAAPTEPGSYFVSTYRTRSYEDVEGEVEALRDRQRATRAMYLANAATLHEAGLRFGFSTADVKPSDVHDNLRMMVENGLPEEAALAALTTDAAAQLGLEDRLGSVEAGKIGNLVVTTAPLFSEDAQVRYVFVDGRPYEYEVESRSEKDADATVNPVGSWDYEVTTPDGAVSGTLTITGTPGAYAGTITSSMLPTSELSGVELDGNELTFTFDAGAYGQPSARVLIDADALEGTVSVPGLGEVPMTGTRASGPNR